MTEPKFTPGPWEAYTERYYSAVYADSGNVEVCYCDTQMEDDDNHTVAANATLIAAAPEMYDMLDMLASCGCISNGIYTAAIRKLLAKARGEEKR